MSNKRMELVAGLQELMEWCVAAPENLLPVVNGYIYSNEYTATGAANALRAMSPCEKEYLPGYLTFKKWFGPYVNIYVDFPRSSVCIPKMLGKKQVPAITIPAHEEDVMEWDCTPIFEAALKEKINNGVLA